MKRKEPVQSEDSYKLISVNGQFEHDFGAVALHIFGQDSKETILAIDPVTQKVSKKSILQNSYVWIHRVLEKLQPSLRSSDEDSRPGRLGNSQVRFDSTAQFGTLVMSQDRLHAQAQSNLSSVKANVCLYSGKWQYEVQLESKGVMQLGWALPDEHFSVDGGVGDSVYSFAFDGNRKKKWNLGAYDYGEAWQIGDVIGFTIDLDVGSIHFYRNGKDMGEAFSSIPLGPGCAYFPAISLALEEKLQANFGSLPFKYPVETFQPVQKPPTGYVLRSNQLLHWLYRIASLLKVKYSSNKEKPAVSQENIALLFSEAVIRHLSDFVGKPYIVEACLVPFLLDITFANQPSARSLTKLDFVCDALAFILEEQDLNELLIAVCKCLIHKFNQTSVSLEYHRQKSSLVMLADICQNSNIRHSLLKQLYFVKTRVPEFMDVKPIDLVVLKQTMSQAWWPLQEQEKDEHKQKEYEARKKSYLGNCRTVQSKAIELESLQESLLVMLMNNRDGTSSEPSSRKLYLKLFRQFLKDNHITGLVSFFLNDQSVEQTPLSIALNYFHRLVSVVRVLWGQELPSEQVCVPLSMFYSGDVDYFTIDRLGGVLSHLIHTLHAPLAAQLGETHRVFTEPDTQASALPSVQVQVRGIDTNTGAVSMMSRWISVHAQVQPGGPGAPSESLKPGAVDNAASLAELLDGVIMLYNISAHKQLYKISALRDEMDKYVIALSEARARLRLAQDSCPEAAEEINTSIKTLELKVEELSRVVMAWVRGVIYTPEKRGDLMWLLRAVLLTLERASEQGELFAFVPDYYVEVLVEICSALRNYFSPTLPLEELAGFKKLFVQVAEFLVKNFADPRVVNLGSKDTLVEALAGFIAKRQTLDCLESISHESQKKLVTQLLKPYENRPWGQSNWVLMRVWQGCGFAFRYKKSPHLIKKLGPRTFSSESGLLIHQAFDPCPSPQYQQLVARALMEDQEMAAEFLNSVLKQLNWSFSEFISMMQEIQNLSKRPDRIIIDARQLKICATCFDFVVSLLRVLEMICFVCLPIFNDPSREGTENLLERLCQLLSQILLRATTPQGCLIHVISLEVPDLDSVDQFPVLSAVVGVLVALLADDLNNKGNNVMSTAAKTLLSEPAFQIDSIKYVLGEAETSKDKPNIFSLENYPQTVTKEEVEIVRHLVSTLSHYKTLMAVVSDVDDEELCPICCAMPLAVTFMPCNHRSCKSCITHHLMDCKECFFCKSAIKSVIATDGTMLFDSKTSLLKAPDPHPPI